MQTLDCSSSAGRFSPYKAKNDLQKKKRAMLPQANDAFYVSYSNNVEQPSRKPVGGFQRAVSSFPEGQATPI